MHRGGRTREAAQPRQRQGRPWPRSGDWLDDEDSSGAGGERRQDAKVQRIGHLEAAPAERLKQLDARANGQVAREVGERPGRGAGQRVPRGPGPWSRAAANSGETASRQWVTGRGSSTWGCTRETASGTWSRSGSAAPATKPNAHSFKLGRRFASTTPARWRDAPARSEADKDPGRPLPAQHEVGRGDHGQTRESSEAAVAHAAGLLEEPLKGGLPRRCHRRDASARRRRAPCRPTGTRGPVTAPISAIFRPAAPVLVLERAWPSGDARKPARRRRAGCAGRRAAGRSPPAAPRGRAGRPGSADGRDDRRAARPADGEKRARLVTIVGLMTSAAACRLRRVRVRGRSKSKSVSSLLSRKP